MTTENNMAQAPVERLVGRFFTLHTWAKVNQRDASISDWYVYCILPLLESGRLMPKRFMLYCDLTYPQIWHRITHDFPNIHTMSIAAMDARAAYRYATALYARRNPPNPSYQRADQEVAHGK